MAGGTCLFSTILIDVTHISDKVVNFRSILEWLSNLSLQEHPGCEIYGQTVTVDHHEELVKVGINPCLKGTKTEHKFPNVIFCAPPSRTSDYPGDVR